jgi:hypothetical protein
LYRGTGAEKHGFSTPNKLNTYYYKIITKAVFASCIFSKRLQLKKQRVWTLLGKRRRSSTKLLHPDGDSTILCSAFTVASFHLAQTSLAQANDDLTPKPCLFLRFLKKCKSCGPKRNLHQPTVFIMIKKNLISEVFLARHHMHKPTTTLLQNHVFWPNLKVSRSETPFTVVDQNLFHLGMSVECATYLSALYFFSSQTI